ncbi:Alpha-terpineol synthase [Nymphaea thermarum]|nr:Alpha-terpineol synthase [Nymphaea thermarum]
MWRLRPTQTDLVIIEKRRPTKYPSTTEQVAPLELINSLERLGVAYHFESEISRFSANIREDVRGLLSLYKASQLACEEETMLEKASAFSSEHLRARISRMDQRMSPQVQRALQVPLHKRVRRVKARECMSLLGWTSTWCRQSTKESSGSYPGTIHYCIFA